MMNIGFVSLTVSSPCGETSCWTCDPSLSPCRDLRSPWSAHTCLHISTHAHTHNGIKKKLVGFS